MSKRKLGIFLKIKEGEVKKWIREKWEKILKEMEKAGKPVRLGDVKKMLGVDSK